MNKRVWSVLLILVLSISLVLTGCSKPAEAPVTTPATPEAPAPEAPKPVGEIKIGAVYPLTGAIALTGTRVKQAIELAEQIINGEYDMDLPMAKTVGLPNLGGAKVKFIFGDSQANPEIGKAEAERLITSEKVVSMLGAYQSSVTKPTSQVAERYKVPYLCAASSSAALTERDFKYFVRIAPTDDTDSRVFLEYCKYLNEKFNADIKKIALVYENTEFGVHAADMAKKWVNEEYKDYGFEIVADVPYTFSSTNVNSEVQTIKAAKPDAIFQASIGGDWIQYVKTYKALDFSPKVVLNYCGGFQDPKSIENLGSDANFYSGQNAFAGALIDKMPVLEKVNDMYKAVSGVDFDGPALEIFAGAIVIAEAINEAASTEADAIMKVLLEKEFKSPVLVAGKIKFNENIGGQNYFAESVIVQVQDGNFQVTYPAEVATSDPVVPIPKWSDRK